MASGGAEEDDGGVALDIDNVHMLLQGQSIPVLLLMLQHVMSWNHSGGQTMNCVEQVLFQYVLHHHDTTYNMYYEFIT